MIVLVTDLHTNYVLWICRLLFWHFLQSGSCFPSNGYPVRLCLNFSGWLTFERILQYDIVAVGAEFRFVNIIMTRYQDEIPSFIILEYFTASVLAPIW
jgi:hypothetical protein